MGMHTGPHTNSPADDSPSAVMPTGAGLLLRADALFEGVLGFVLVTSTLTGLDAALMLPAPAIRPVVVICGLLLLPFLPLLWRAARTPRRRFLLALAIANGAGAAVFALWVLIWHGAFHAAGAAFILALAVILGVLATLQVRVASAAT